MNNVPHEGEAMTDPCLSQEERRVLERLLKRNPNPLEEDQLKQLLRQRLESDGWQVKVRMGQAKGIDLDATRASARWIIEAKGWAGGSEPQQGNYFCSAVAELLQRMAFDDAKYSLAFPDIPRYRGLWERFPIIAKRRTGISCIFVNRQGTLDEAQ